MWMIWNFLLLAAVVASAQGLRACTKDDYQYEYTSCDSAGGRWRVAVPKSAQLCQPSSTELPLPSRGKNCEFTCKAGQYLEMESQECKPCSAGTFSLGGGARFDDWDILPSGFRSELESFSHASEAYHDSRSVNCSGASWIPKGSYISSQSSQCTAILVYSATLVKPGHVTFEYQYTDEGVVFHFSVKNDQCQSYSSSRNSKWPVATKKGKWGKVTVPLKTGLNVMTWKTIGMMSDESSKNSNPTLIRKIEVDGVAYTSQCTKCRNGTYSSDGAESCTQCPMNHFSARGAGTCVECDKATEYSEKGATKCVKRPACTEHDYYMVHTPCDASKKTTKTYYWIQPQICRTDLPGSVQLPKNGSPEDCPPCNPGQHFVNGSGCQFCPENHYSDGLKPCESCPASTSPIYGIDYKWWNTIPNNITTNCISVNDETCSKESTWVPAGDHIHTQFGHDRQAYLVLTLHIDGFKGTEDPSHNVEVGTVTFTFETSCKQECDFIFLSDAGGHSDVVKEWTGNQAKTVYNYNVMSTKPLVLSWAFERAEDFGQTHLDDIAKIYNIQVTNTDHGGATKCQQCPMGVHKDGCVPCPDGHYIDRNSTVCVPCPQNTVIKSGNEWGIESCQECGPGLVAKGGKRCETDCTFTDANGHVFDFTPIRELQFVQGNPLFTASGTQYYHGFNISLCASDANKVSCQNNITHKNKDSGEAGADTITSMICRSTMVPQRDSNNVVTTQSVSIADYLTEIVTNLSYTSDMHEQYKKEGIPFEGMEKDVHFYFKSESKTDSCPDGRSTIISLRCDPKEDGEGEISMPPKCSDGTCDGCSFHFLWKTQHACHVCSEKDYEKIIGECKDGEQIIHYNVPTHCFMKEKAPQNTKQKCTLKLTSLPFELQIAIPVIICLGIILIILLIFCWSKNRKLEYKYMKLVEGSGPNSEMELPGVDSCALEDGEEEQFDSVSFKEAKGKGLFSKLRGKKKGLDDENPFETAHSEKIPLT